MAGRRASTVGRLIELSARYFRRRPPRALPPALYRRIVHPLLVRRTRGRRRRALKQSEAYFPYFSMSVHYDDRRARHRLAPAGIEVAPIERYFTRLAHFAVRSRWGRRTITRAEAQTDPESRARTQTAGRPRRARPPEPWAGGLRE